MIYKKDANFPYPILTNGSTSYKNGVFILDIALTENTESYRFNIEYEIGSSFIESLISDERAVLIFIIQSKDNKFYILKLNQLSMDIPKKRLSLSNRTSIQLHIMTNSDIDFSDNNDLTSFYDTFKKDIYVPKDSVLGFSNTVVMEGRMEKPLELFDKKLDENLPSEIKIELGAETIIIHYKSAEFQFGDMRNKAFNNPYIYTGLRTALLRFINTYADSGDDYVELTQISTPENLLDYKLHQLMLSKMIDEITTENIDEVISKISDRVIEKYAGAVKELVSNGN